MTRALRHCSILSITLAAAGCVAEPDPVAVGQEEILGLITFDSCNATEQASLRRAVGLGSWIVQTPEFVSCMQGSFGHSYRPCTDEDDMQTVSSGITAARSPNPTQIECEELADDRAGQAFVDDWGHTGREEITIDRGFLGSVGAQPFGHNGFAALAGIVWHEVMHQHGYRHGNSDAESSIQERIENRDDCGQGATWIWDVNSMPYHAQACVAETATRLGRLRVAAAGYAGDAMRFRGALVNAALGAQGLGTSAQVDTAVLAMAWERKLRVEHSQMCLDIPDGAKASGAAINQFPCHGGANQRWVTLPLAARPLADGRLPTLIMNLNSGKCIDRPNGDLANRTPMQQSQCHGAFNQQWVQRSTSSGPQWEALGASGLPSGQCLDVPDASLNAGVRIQLSRCKTSGDLRNQVFRLVF